MAFIIKEGDTSPALLLQMQDSEQNPVNISGSSVQLIAVDEETGETVITEDTTGNLEIVDAINGIVKYPWKSADTENARTLLYEFEVEYTDGAVETFPNDSYNVIEIIKDLN